MDGDLGYFAANNQIILFDLSPNAKIRPDAILDGFLRWVNLILLAL